MNKQRRKRIEKIIMQLQALKDEIEDIQTEEENYRDNMPENLVSSKRYELAEEACSDLELTVDSINEALEYLDMAI